MEKTKPNCKFVLTYIYCDWDVNGAIGVYDNKNEVLGKIIDLVFDAWEIADPKIRGYDPEFNFKFSHDSANDLYYDIEIKFPWQEDLDIYRVYYLREEENG